MSNEDLVHNQDTSESLDSVKKKSTRKIASRKKLVEGNNANSDEISNADYVGRMEFSPDEGNEHAPEKNNSIEENSTNIVPERDSNSDNEKTHKSNDLKNHERGNRSSSRNGKNNRFKRSQNSNNKRGAKKQGSRRPNRRNRTNSSDYDLIDFEAYIDHGSFQSFEGIKALYASIETSDSVFEYDKIYAMDLNELREALKSKSINLDGHKNRNSMVQALFDKAIEEKQSIITTGILDIPEEGMGGFLVYELDSYRIKLLNAYLPQKIIEHFGLKKGHIIKAELHGRIEDTNCAFVVDIKTVMDESPEKVSEWEAFTDLIPYYPLDRIILESDIVSDKENLPMRVVDCLTPIGFGQRGLIVAPPRTGKTILMQGIANSIQINCPDAHLIVLLIDERPEEVTDFKRKVEGEVISSTFDESADSHVRAAEVVIEKSRRMVEAGKDVIILLDSITRLARAYNTSMPSSGKILSGGVEANALQLPKRFFGSARNIEEGGSLTIIATALVDTGSRMDDVIYEEFKGTGNMELHLDRIIAEKRIYPAININRSGTRREEKLTGDQDLQKIWILRKLLHPMEELAAMEFLLERLKATKNNAEFFDAMKR